MSKGYYLRYYTETPLWDGPATMALVLTAAHSGYFCPAYTWPFGLREGAA